MTHPLSAACARKIRSRALSATQLACLCVHGTAFATFMITWEGVSPVTRSRHCRGVAGALPSPPNATPHAPNQHPRLRNRCRCVYCIFRQVFDKNKNMALMANVSPIQMVVVPNAILKAVKNTEPLASCTPNNETAICQISTEGISFPAAWFDIVDGTVTIKYGFQGQSTDEMGTLATNVPLRAKERASEVSEATPLTLDLPDYTIHSGDEFKVDSHVYTGAGDVESIWLELRFSEGEPFSGVEYDAGAWNVYTVASTPQNEQQIVDVVLMRKAGQTSSPFSFTCTSAGIAGELGISARLKFLSTTEGNLVYATMGGGAEVPMMGRDGSESVIVASESIAAIFPYTDTAELLNSVKLTGERVEFPIHIATVSSAGTLSLDAQVTVSCVSEKTDVLQVDAGCKHVYFDGSESQAGTVRIQVIPTGALSGKDFFVDFHVWLPKLPLSMDVQGKLQAAGSVVTLGRVNNWRDAQTCAGKFKAVYATVSATISGGTSAGNKVVDVTSLVCNTIQCNVQSSDGGIVAVTSAGNGRVLLQGLKAGTAKLGHATLFGGYTEQVFVSDSEADSVTISNVEFFVLASFGVDLPASMIGANSDMWVAAAAAGSVSSNVLRENPVIAEAYLSDGTAMLITDVASLAVEPLDDSSVVVAKSSSTHPYCKTGPCVLTTGSGHGSFSGTWNMGMCGSLSGVGNVFIGDLSDVKNVVLSTDEAKITHETDQAAQAGIASLTNFRFVAEVDGKEHDLTAYADTELVSITFEPPNVVVSDVIGNQHVLRVQASALAAKSGGSVTVTATFNSGTQPVTAKWDIQVVFGDKLELKTFAYPVADGEDKTPQSELALIGDTNEYQHVSVEMHLILTDGAAVDVTQSTQNWLLGGSSAQLRKLSNGVTTLTHPRSAGATTAPQGFTIRGEFGLDTMRNKDTHTGSSAITFASAPLKVTEVLGISFVETYSGRKALVAARLEDGSSIQSYGGEIEWSSSEPEAVSIDSNGNVAFAGNWYTPVTITASLTTELISTTTTVEANLAPAVGDVDVGATEGVPISAVRSGATFSVPVRFNFGSKAVDYVSFGVEFNATVLELVDYALLPSLASLASAGGSLSSATASDGVIDFQATSIKCSVDDCVVPFASLSFRLRASASAGDVIELTGFVNAFVEDGAKGNSATGINVISEDNTRSATGTVSFQVDDDRRGRRALHDSRVAVIRRAVDQAQSNCPVGDLTGDCEFNLLDAQACIASVVAGGNECNFDMNDVADLNDAAYVFDVLRGNLPIVRSVLVTPVAQFNCQFTASVELEDAEGTQVYFVLTSAAPEAFAQADVTTGNISVAAANGATVLHADVVDGTFVVEALLGNGSALIDSVLGVSVFIVDPVTGASRLLSGHPERPSVGQIEFEVGAAQVSTGRFSPLRSVTNILDSASCEAVSDQCTGNPCLNGATCENKYASGYFCACATNYTGPRCGDNINDPDYQKDTSSGSGASRSGSGSSGSGSSGSGVSCADTPCTNGGACRDEPSPWGTAYYCDCPWPFASSTDCSAHTCDVNNGGCIPNHALCNRDAEGEETLCDCFQGYSGRTCDEYLAVLTSNSANSDSVMSTTIIGVIALCSVILMVGIVVFVLRMKKLTKELSKGAESDVEESNAKSKKHDFENIDTTQPVSPYPSKPPSYTPPEHASTQFDSSGARKIESPINQLKILEGKVGGDAGAAPCDREFASVPKANPSKTFRVSELPENKIRNRYRDIRAYDDTRVRLMNADNDYINANHVVSSVAGRQFWYIACQGPTPGTCADYWEMIWEQQSLIILMVTNDVEGGRVKCEKYWPDQGSDKVYGDLTITVDKSRSNDTYTIRALKVQHRVTGETRKIWMLHFTAWPDHGCPEDEGLLLAYVDEVRAVRSRLMNNSQSADWPIVVHCSAGCGRTGVYMAVEIGLARLEAGELVDVKTIMEELREQRYGLIQTADQYKFCYLALIKAMYNSELVRRQGGNAKR